MKDLFKVVLFASGFVVMSFYGYEKIPVILGVAIMTVSMLLLLVTKMFKNNDSKEVRNYAMQKN